MSNPTPPTPTASLDNVDLSKVVKTVTEITPVIETPTTPPVTPPVIETPPAAPTPPPAAEPAPPTPPPPDPNAPYIFKEQRTTVEQAWTAPTTWSDEAETLNMPSHFDQEVSRNLLNTPKINLVDSPEGRKWASVLQEGVDLTMAENAFVPSLEAEHTDWRQAVHYNGAELRGRQPNIGGGNTNQVLTGERAVLQILTHVGSGSIFQVPLWHTGIWLTLKPPMESELVELNRILVAQKIELGRYTYGLAFSNSIVYTIEHLVDFALRHVYDTSIKLDVSNTRALKDLIVTQDIPTLLWGLACAMYPKGFQYRRACMEDPATCNHIVEEVINLRKLLWVDRTALTDWQRSHMSSWRSASMEMETINRYRSEMLSLNDFTIRLYENTDREMRIVLKSPTVSDYIDSGYRWIGGIVELVEKTLAAQSRSDERTKLITQHGQATAMRQYTHWIRAIQIVSHDEVVRSIEDREAIEKVCDALSGDDAVRNTFLTKVAEYINQSTHAVIGIPTYDCPACKTPQESSLVLPHHRNVIPLDVNQTFFALLTQRMARIAQR